MSIEGIVILMAMLALAGLMAGFALGAMWDEYRRAGRFKPGVFYNEPMRLTQIILEDTSIVWCPWGPYKGHAVDLGYDFDGNLVAIQIWDDVRERNTPTESIHRGAEQLRELYGDGAH